MLDKYEFQVGDIIMSEFRNLFFITEDIEQQADAVSIYHVNRFKDRFKLVCRKEMREDFKK